MTGPSPGQRAHAPRRMAANEHAGLEEATRGETRGQGRDVAQSGMAPTQCDQRLRRARDRCKAILRRRLLGLTAVGALVVRCGARRAVLDAARLTRRL